MTRRRGGVARVVVAICCSGLLVACASAAVVTAPRWDTRAAQHETGATPLSPATYDAYSIVGNGVTTVTAIKSFLLEHHPTIDRRYLGTVVTAYLIESALENVNHDLALAQMMLETNYLKFTGVVDADQNNFAGIGAINNDVPGHSFATVREGVRAHVQHLVAYASQAEPWTAIVDPRFHLVQRGSAQTAHELTGRWATDPHYGDKIESLTDHLLQHGATGTSDTRYQ